jgi:hypothetical protein
MKHPASKRAPKPGETSTLPGIGLLHAPHGSGRLPRLADASPAEQAESGADALGRPSRSGGVGVSQRRDYRCRNRALSHGRKQRRRRR